MFDADTLKRAGRLIKRNLRVGGHDVSHMACLNAVAAGYGFREWSPLSQAGGGEPNDWNHEAAADRLCGCTDIPRKAVDAAIKAEIV